MVNQEGLVTAAVYSRRRGVSRAAVVKARKSGRLRECFVAGPGGRILINPDVADREWAENTDLTRWSIAKRDQIPAEEPEVTSDEPSIPLSMFSVFTNRDLGVKEPTIVILGVGDGGPDSQVIPMSPQTARLVATKMLLLARDCGEDISHLVARRP